MKKFIICMVTGALLLVFQLVGLFGSLADISATMAVDSAKNCSDLIAEKVDETVDLLTALSETDSIRGTQLTNREKAAALTKISKQFGYMMIRILDKDFNVYSETAARPDGISSNLSKRDYLQELKKTLEPQITDAFLAGADGKTVNFTIAVPVFDGNGEFNGGLFAAIYESDFASQLVENRAVLLGRHLQFMSGVDVDDVGYLLDDELSSVWLLGKTSESRMLEIVSDESRDGHFWGMRLDGILAYAYDKVEGTPWNVVCRITFVNAINESPLLFSMYILGIAATIFLLAAAIYYRERFFR